MNRDADTIIARAARWHLASAQDDMDWDGFAAWLDADPRHRTAYDEIALTDAALGEIAMPAETAAPIAANDDEGTAHPVRRRGWAVWGGGALAASLAALALVPQLTSPAPETYATGADAKTIALADGSRIELAPHSRLTIEGRQQERIALDGGAWFAIRHDPSRQLVIDAAGVAISDIGTSFDVQAAAGRIAVEVAEGEVVLTGAGLGKPMKLAAGRAFRLDARAGTAVTSTLADGEAGEWREGRLSYRSEALGLVAADLARYAGVRIELSEGIANRQFSGTLAVEDGEAAVRDLAQLMGLGVERSGAGYRLVAR
ncbi:MAG: FecR family protein [Erythrobacter sp.]